MSHPATNTPVPEEPATESSEEANEEKPIGVLAAQIEATTGFDLNQAKVIVYYAVATHGLHSLDEMPALILDGTIHTGKSTTIKSMKLLVYKPHTPGGKLTEAVLRDALKPETTVLIEAGDKIDEDFLEYRFSRNEGNYKIKRQHKFGWKDEVLNLFGALVLHRRRALSDPSARSRSIVLYARPKPEEDVLPFDADIIAEYASTIRAIASRIDWKQVKDTGHRANIKYAAMLLAAKEVADEDFIAYAADEIEAEKAALLAGQDEELRIVVYRAVMAEATDEGRLTRPLPRVDLADVKKRVRDDADWITNYMISQTIANDLGFETKKVGGPMRVMIGGRDRLKAIADKINYEDEWFEMTQEKEEPNT